MAIHIYTILAGCMILSAFAISALMNIDWGKKGGL